MADFTIERRPAATYVGLAVDVTMDTIAERVEPAFEDLERYLASRGIVPTGPTILRYRRVMMSAPFTLQIGYVVDDMPWIDHPFEADLVPAATYVVARHHGPYAQLGQVTEEAMAWGDAQGVDFAVEEGRADGHGNGDTWEAWYEWYPTEPESGPEGPQGSAEVCLLVRGTVESDD